MSEKAPGFEEYTPSRLEWLSVMLNSHTPFLSFPSIDYVFIPGSDGKSLKVYIEHDKKVDSNRVNTYIEALKTHALNMANLYKWDSWLEIQTELVPIDSLPKE